MLIGKVDSFELEETEPHEVKWVTENYTTKLEKQMGLKSAWGGSVMYSAWEIQRDKQLNHAFATYSLMTLVKLFTFRTQFSYT